MITFLDGPADKVLQLRRAPLYLRVVIDASGEVDALDQLDDKPKANEKSFAYKRKGPAGSYHLLVRGEHSRTCGGWWASGNYEVCDPQPSEDVMRDNAQWREWATQQQDIDPSAPMAEN